VVAFVVVRATVVVAVVVVVVVVDVVVPPSNAHLYVVETFPLQDEACLKHDQPLQHGYALKA
jgi:hypothetical protein